MPFSMAPREKLIHFGHTVLCAFICTFYWRFFFVPFGFSFIFFRFFSFPLSTGHGSSQCEVGNYQKLRILLHAPLRNPVMWLIFPSLFGLSLPLSLALPRLRLLVCSWRTQHQLQHRAENVVLHLQWQLKCHSPWLMELTIAPRSPGYSLLTISLSIFPYPLSTQNAAW